VHIEPRPGWGILLGIPAFIMLVLLVALCFLLQNSHNAAFALPRAYGASAFILPLVALYPPSWSAAFALRPSALRGSVRSASMSIPGGAGTALTESTVTFSVLGAPATIMRSELLLGSHCGGSDPSLCPTPIPVTL
jgi:hypothetical protein